MRSIADDLVIQTLADSEAELRERISSLEADVRGYRTVLVQALVTLHVLTRERDDLRRESWRLRDQIRKLVDVTHKQTEARKRRAA